MSSHRKLFCSGQVLFWSTTSLIEDRLLEEFFSQNSNWDTWRILNWETKYRFEIYFLFWKNSSKGHQDISELYEFMYKENQSQKYKIAKSVTHWNCVIDHKFCFFTEKKTWSLSFDTGGSKPLRSCIWILRLVIFSRDIFWNSKSRCVFG